MVEQAMFFLMGFLVAGLIALLFVPVLARRATRLSQARARLTAPLSEKQAVAERDLLRAEHAVEFRRMEQRMAKLADAVAGHRAELGRGATRIVALEETGAELARKSDEARALGAELASAHLALHDFAAQIDRARAEMSRQRARLLELETAADKHRTVFAGFETRASGLEIELDDSRRDAQALSRSARLEQTRQAKALLSQQQDIDRLGASLADAMAKGAILVAEIEGKSRQLDEARARLGEAEAQLARSERGREDALMEGSQLLKGIGERAPTRRQLQRLQARLAAAEGKQQGDAPLREAIARLGLEVARLAARQPEKAPAPSNLLNFELRESGAPVEFADDGPKGSTMVKLRQTQPMAPER